MLDPHESIWQCQLTGRHGAFSTLVIWKGFCDTLISLRGFPLPLISLFYSGFYRFFFSCMLYPDFFFFFFVNSKNFLSFLTHRVGAKLFVHEGISLNTKVLYVCYYYPFHYYLIKQNAVNQLARCTDKVVSTDVSSQADYLCLSLGNDNNYIIG